MGTVNLDTIHHKNSVQTAQAGLASPDPIREQVSSVPLHAHRQRGLCHRVMLVSVLCLRKLYIFWSSILSAHSVPPLSPSKSSLIDLNQTYSPNQTEKIALESSFPVTDPNMAPFLLRVTEPSLVACGV